MSKKTVLFLIFLTITFYIATSSPAALIDRGEGLIYDDDLNITWLQYANYTNQTMTWNEATVWVENLIYQGYDDWRLPFSDVTCTGYNCTESEMGHLFYGEGITANSPGFFVDVRAYYYWSATEYESDTTKAWRFSFKDDSGYQGTSSKSLNRYAMAVRDGESSLPVAPEPVSSVLFIAGGATIGMRRFYKNYIC